MPSTLVLSGALLSESAGLSAQYDVLELRRFEGPFVMDDFVSFKCVRIEECQLKRSSLALLIIKATVIEISKCFFGVTYLSFLDGSTISIVDTVITLDPGLIAANYYFARCFFESIETWTLRLFEREPGTAHFRDCVFSHAALVVYSDATLEFDNCCWDELKIHVNPRIRIVLRVNGRQIKNNTAALAQYRITRDW